MDWNSIDAVLFDLDGVLTPTAEVHMTAWDTMFNEFLDTQPDQPPYTERDYFDYVDGKPRYDGVRSFLTARGIELPEGQPSDAAVAETVCGLGNRKNDAFSEVLKADGVQPYPGSVAFLDDVVARGKAVAVVSSSRNAESVLNAAGLRERFEVIVDGNLADNEGLPGKPAPDTFLYAAAQLGASADTAIVVEDALSGVAAGRAGNFRHVIGVDRGVGAEELAHVGADVVVTDLAELVENNR